MTLDRIVHWNHLEKGEEVISRYSLPQLQERLARYNAPDAVVCFDDDDTIQPSPAKVAALRCLSNPHLLARNIHWIGEVAREVVQNRSLDDLEIKAFNYWVGTVLAGLSEEEVALLAAQSATPFYPAVVETAAYYDHAHTIICSRNIPQIVERSAVQLGCEQSYSRVENKGVTIAAHARKVGARCVLLLGDSEDDFEAAEHLRREYLPVEMVAVQRKLNSRFDPRATVFIPRDFSGLYQQVLLPTIRA